MLVFLAFVIIPTGYTFYVSLWKWNALNPALSKFKGLGNYSRLFDATQPTFLSSLWHSLYFTGAMVLGGTAISLALALLLQRGGMLLNGTRAAIFLPHATPVIATSMIWTWIFNAKFGLADWVAAQPAPADLAVAAVLVLGDARGGHLQPVARGRLHHRGVPRRAGHAVHELSEAARADGCSAWQEFWHVTWHQLKPVTVFVVAITAITSLQAFTQFYQLADGGPAYATTTLSYLVYQEAFVFSDTGYGAALAVVLFAVTVFFTLVRRRTAAGGESHALL